MIIPKVDGLLSRQDIRTTGDTIAALQLDSGMIEWFPGGHADPWNHVEAAMALTVTGHLDHAKGAYGWLADIQLPDGSWHNYYVAHGIEDPKIDTNTVAYIATGLWHYWLATHDTAYVRDLFEVVETAIDFVVAHERDQGGIIWARWPDRLEWDYALLTGTSSISHSLLCADQLAKVLGLDYPRWRAARQRLVSTVADDPTAFEPKERWAMDWYYPALTGAVVGDDAEKQFMVGWDTFVMAGRGVRCVSDEDWVTAAETAEATLAALAVGLPEHATKLFTWAQALRDQDGSYFTGIAYPDEVTFPAGERSSYTSAAIVLAADALDAENPTARLFTNHE